MFKGWPFYSLVEKMVTGVDVVNSKTKKLSEFITDIGSRYTFDVSVMDTYKDLLNVEGASKDLIIVAAINIFSQYVSLCKCVEPEKYINELDDSLKKLVLKFENRPKIFEPETIIRISPEDCDVEKLAEIESFSREEVLAHGDLIKKFETSESSSLSDNLYNKFAKSLLEKSHQPYIDARTISDQFLDAVIKLSIDHDMIVSGSGRRKVMKKPSKK